MPGAVSCLEHAAELFHGQPGIPDQSPQRASGQLAALGHRQVQVRRLASWQDDVLPVWWFTS